jgi:ATP-dependent DNA helicase PIF1
MNYTVRQQEFIDRVKAGENIFLTGKAGTGKSFIVKEAIQTLNDEGKRVIALAPTGIAANNIDGQTIHSMFSLCPYGVLGFDECKFMKDAKKLLLRKVDTIFIDEVSMLRPDILDAIHLTLKKNGLPGLDKRQIIFVGDLKQLPSPLDDNTRSVLYQTYDGDTLHFANIYKKLNVQTVELDEVLRQSNEEFISHLNIIREGGRSEYFRKFVHDKPNGIILAPHNATVKQYNIEGLKQQKGELFTFTAEITGEVRAEDFQLEEEVQVKNGCKIMYLVNSQENPLRNGTLGMFVSHNGCHYIRVGNVDYALSPVMLTKKKYVYDKEADALKLEEIGSIEQYPIKLAYALSIHKAQGLTFDEVTIDLTRPCFQKGQMYVALSRVRTPEGLRILTSNTITQ